MTEQGTQRRTGLVAILEFLSQFLKIQGVNSNNFDVIEF